MKTKNSFFIAFFLMVFALALGSCNKDDKDPVLQLKFQKNISGDDIPIGDQLLVNVTANKSCTLTVNIDSVLLDRVENFTVKTFNLPTYLPGEHLMEVIGDDGVTKISSQWIYVVKTK